jgi:hypothetical protein
VTREKTPQHRPDGHILVPSAAIGGLSMALAAGLAALGPMEKLNQSIATLVSLGGAETFPKQLPIWSLWTCATWFAFGLAAVILSTSGAWRRAVLWVSSVVLVAGWAPVLSLAAHAPDIGVPLVATLWSGVCALVYASNHHMPCDRSPSSHP